MPETTYTWGEMEAYRLMVAAGQLPEKTVGERDLILEAAAAVLALADRITRERQRSAMKR